MKLEVLHVPDCPNLHPLLDRLHEITDLPITTREITTDAEAQEFGMTGSPTLLVNGKDPFANADQCDCGVSCRLYRNDHGQIVPTPSTDQLRNAITPGAILSDWRTRALPLTTAERATHQFILRTFAITGHPPTPNELDTDVLRALHDMDAIRLTPDGQIAVAYPFSATPTRHRVRIDHKVDAYAMCAIDALGIFAMLDQDTQIESTDATTGERITVTTTTGQTTWNPASAVVFISTTAGEGPSATSCCAHLNFFTNPTTATTWMAKNPDVPGELLTQNEAHTLGTRLFQPLLTD